MALDSYKRRAIDMVPEKEYIEGSDKEGLYTSGKGSVSPKEKDLSSYDYLQMEELLEEDVKFNSFKDILEEDIIAKTILKCLFSAEEIGKATINVPSNDKKAAQIQENKMEPLDKEVYGKISGDISEEDKIYQEDAEAEYERLLREVEG